MKIRDKQGQFTQKSDEFRQVRSIRLTDSTWEKLGKAADSQSITRADLIEKMAEAGAFEADTSQQTSLTGISRDDIARIVAKVLEDPKVTRNGKDREPAKRSLEALLNELGPVLRFVP